jgi:thiamine biosynthesis lipoprotein
MYNISYRKWIALAFALVAAVLLIILPNKPKKQYFHHQGTIFGTYYNIRYEGEADWHEAIKQRLHDLDNSLSMFNAQSVISRVNRNEAVVVDTLFAAMYDEAYAVSRLSGGAFDITVAPLVNAWGFGTRGRAEGEAIQVDVDSIKTFVGYEKIRMEGGRLEKTDERIVLDASAIAKGYACDLVAGLLREKGCENLLVDIGGEVVLQGVNDKGSAWRVGIARPKVDANGAEEELQEVIASSNLCMATSGNYLQYYYAEGQRRSHTIDPRSGYPVDHSLLSATVVAGSCMRADALATACMVLGPDASIEMIEKTRDAACYLIVAKDTQLHVVTSGRWMQNDSIKAN